MLETQDKNKGLNHRCCCMFRVVPSRRESVAGSPGAARPPATCWHDNVAFTVYYFRARPQKRRMCKCELGRSASAGRNIDLVQIQRLLLQTDEDLREASLRPQRNKCGTTTQRNTCVLGSSGCLQNRSCFTSRAETPFLFRCYEGVGQYWAWK